MDVSSGLARTFFSGMLKTTNLVIVETITLSNFCPLMNLFMHLGFDFVDIRTYGVNLIIYCHVFSRKYGGSNSYWQ